MKLGKLVDFNPATKVRRGVQAPFIDMAALPTNGKYISKTSNRFFSGSGAKFTNGDTLVARITPCLENGKGAYVSELEKNGFGSTEFIVLRAKNNSDNQFIYYLTRWSKFREYAIQGMTGTSGRQRVSWQTLSDFECATINKKNRFLIGGVLSRLDDKIELNRKMNETLEQMAQAVFQDWFVDFGPVKRKAEGISDPVAILGGLILDPTKAQEIANFFPDEIADDDLPEGWRRLSIGGFVNIKGGKQLAKTKFSETGLYPVFGGAGQMGNTNQYNAEGHILTVGRVGAYCGQFFSYIGKAWVNNNASLITPHDNKISLWLFYVLKNLNIETIKKGAAQPFICNSDILSMKTIFGGKNIIEKFVELMSPNFELKENYYHQNRILAEMRDLLLPKLMSGEISVDDLEKKMGDVL